MTRPGCLVASEYIGHVQLKPEGELTMIASGPVPLESDSVSFHACDEHPMRPKP